MMKLLWPVLLSGLSFNVFAQAGTPENGPPQEGPPRWQLGVGAIVTDSPYAGEGTRLMPFPLVRYEGEHFYAGIGGIGWRIIKNDAFELAVVGKVRFDGFDVDDLGRQALARNGIDYRLLEDRDKAFEMGANMKWSGAAGEIEAELLADATDTSGGHEISIQYGYPIPLGSGVLSPNLSVAWQSDDMANYYYGTLDKEVARGVVNYKPGAVTLPSVGFSYFRPVGERWSLMAFAKYTRLPDEIQNSPLIERGTQGTGTLFIGFSRGF